MVTLNLSVSPLEDSVLVDSVTDIADIVAKIEVMREQEETTYKTVDYLVTNESCLKHATKPVDEVCRVKMCEWCFQVVDFCRFRRETVSIGMSYLDRYLSTPKGRKALLQRKEYQLSAMTALYIAIKIHEPLEMETSLLADLSRGCYDEMEFVAMEQIMLEAIEWKVSGPTTLGFAQLFIALMDSDLVHYDVKTAITDYARFQIELSTFEHSFVDCLPSEIALAAVLNAIEGMDVALFPLEVQSKFIRAVERYTGLVADHVEPLQSNLSVLLIKLISDDQKLIDEYFDPEDEDLHVDELRISATGSHSPVSVTRKVDNRA